MKFYLCEIEYMDFSNVENIKIALQKDEVLGVTMKFYPGPEGPKEDSIFGFAQYGNYLYPVVTHKDLKKPKLKYFLVFPKYAFAVTRVVQEVETEPIPIAPDLVLSKNPSFEKVAEYTGLIKISKEEYYVYNLNNVAFPKDGKVIAVEDIEDTSKENVKQKNKEANFLIIGEKYAVKKENVKTILQSDLVAPYKFHGADGFIDYKKIIPVKELDTGRFVVVLQNEAYKTNKISLTSGKIFYHETSGKEILETAEGMFEIIG
ncbi:MAG: hypothetical protein ACK4MM_02790 [Fervidobacterium sp.]